ncbi:zf-HC2 domain-containing protein [Micromonospora robiginosa]|uniref:Zf-HC2 domain-containing protein n=1 Tax=Micromonospora robiginosa TaxID=2749844 RepID=A0AAF0T0C0_9ACTN|nr:zf-HC2 domain-containing protein [Micromonospora ferruginea]WMF04497.1 zf-HC2 domain-containing protein [Micromonospora ferruginea]
MRTGGEHPTSEHEALALYLLGALDETERVAFEAHLAGCGECLSAAGDLGGVTSGLGGLGAADWDEFALPPASVLPPAVSGPAVVRADAPASERADVSRTDVGDAAARGPAGRRSDRPGSPAGGAGSTGPGRRRRATGPTGPGRASGDRPEGRPPALSARRRLLLWAGAAVLALVVLTGGIVAAVGGGGRDDVVLTATGEAPGAGASLSVSITTHEGQGSTIRITATGLRPGLRYRLFAVTRDGVSHPVRDWTASNGPQEVTGELSPPVDQLSFVGVGLTDGTSVVTAPISR